MRGFMSLTSLLFIFADVVYGQHITNPLQDLYARTYHISQKGEFLFAATTVGLTVYKIIGEKAEMVSSFVVENSGSSSIVDGNILYLFAGNSGIKKIDISDPYKLKEVKEIKIVGSAINGDIYKDLLFVSLGSVGFAIISKKDFEVVSQIATASYCPYLKVIDDRLLVFTEKSGVLVYKISNGGVKQRGEIGLSSRVRDVAVSGDYLFLANDIDGITVLKYKAGKFEMRGRFDTPDTARGVAAFKNYLFVADGNTGIILFEIIKDGGLNLMRRQKTGYSTNKVFVSGDYLIVSHDAMGVLLIPISELLKYAR